MKNHKIKLAALLACLWSAGAARAEITLAPIFGDGMVLQRDAPLPVWGRATPDVPISVTFAGQTKTARTDANGNWKVVFDRLPASTESRSLTVTGDGDTETINDVLVGEVWLCAGQSNMEFRLRDDAFAQTALAEAELPSLRLNLWRYSTQWTYNAPFTPAQVQTLAAEKVSTNQWQSSNAQSVREFSAIGWYFGRKLQRKLNVPVGVISLAAGGSPTEAWIRRAALAENAELRAMVQGNSLEKWRVQQHEKLFPLLVRDWRAQWQQGEFPFLYVQLSGISAERGYKSQFWPEFRDSQRRFQSTLTNVGMAVSSDIGAQFDVHPRNKRGVGLRLLRIALARTYGENIEYSGPAPQTLQRDGSTLTVKFAHAAGLTTSDGKDLRGFEIAGEDGTFYPTLARIEGQKVILSSDKVLSPRRVRYAWQPFPDTNLVNAENLPASTFEMSLP